MRLDLSVEKSKRRIDDCVGIRFHRSASIPLEQEGTGYISAVFADDTTELIPHIVKHSPTGFEWGYGGSGPADAALSILTYINGLEFAEKHYMDFKWDCIANLPSRGCDIKFSDIIIWMAQRCSK